MEARINPTRICGLTHARAHLGEIVERTRTEGPQLITHRGKAAAYVVAVADSEEREEPRGTLLEWLRETGILGLGVTLEAPPDPPVVLEK